MLPIIEIINPSVYGSTMPLVFLKFLIVGTSLPVISHVVAS